MRTVSVHNEGQGFRQRLEVGAHGNVSDVPPESGGEDAGPTPEELLLSALGACTSMTLEMFAKRKAWALERVVVTLDGHRDGDTFVIDRRVELRGELDAEQRERLLSIANKCPVHKILTGAIRVDTTLG
jgi:putative redox protein